MTTSKTKHLLAKSTNTPEQVKHMATKYKTTPKEKTIIKLMEMVIDTLSTCKDLSDPAFDMYYVMQDAVNKEVIYPMEQDPRQFREERDYI